MSEDSRDATSSQQDGMPAFLVQPHSAKRRQNAEQIIAPHLDHLQLRLLEDIEEGTVNLEHRLKQSLAIEDVLDIFFLPKLVVAFEEDADKEKSIIEIIQDAVERQRERTTPPQFCTTFDSSYKEYLDYKADEESQTDYEEELRVARAKFFTKKKQWLERERKRMNPKQVELVDVACTELGSLETAQKLRKELGSHRIRIVRMMDGEQTAGLLLVFGGGDEARINDYKEKLEEDNKKHTEGDRSVIVHFILQEPAGQEFVNICKVSKDFIYSDSRSDQLDIKAVTFEGYTIQEDNQPSLILCKVNDSTVDPVLPFKSGSSIRDLIEKAKEQKYCDALAERVEVTIEVQCAEKVQEVQESTLPVLKSPLEDSYSNVFPEQKSVAKRLLERVRHVLRPKNGGLGLESFSHVRFVILVPTFTTLKVQTAERVVECNLVTSIPEWEEHVLMYDMSSKGKFDNFKNEVLSPQNERHLFVIIADESHWGYNWGGAHDQFVNDSELIKAQNLIIVQVSATPYCNLTKASRVPEKYIQIDDGTEEDKWKILSSQEGRSSENYLQLEELHVVKWYPPKQEGREVEKSRYLRLEHFLRTISSSERHHARAKDLDQGIVVKRPLILQSIRQDDWLVELFQDAKVKGRVGNSKRGAGKKRKQAGRDKRGTEDVDDEAQEDAEDVPRGGWGELQPEHMWLADMILSLVYFRTYRWDSSHATLFSLDESRQRVLRSADEPPEIWRLFDKEGDALSEVRDKTILCADDPKSAPSVAHFLERYRGLFDKVDQSYKANLASAAEQVIAKIASRFTEPEYVGNEYSESSGDVKNRDGFSIFVFGKLSAEADMDSDWRLQFISESDRMVLDLLPGGGSKWERRECECHETCRQVWCVSGPMKIVRVMKGEYGRMVSEVLKTCCDYLFRCDPELASDSSMLGLVPNPGLASGASDAWPGTPFAIIRDFGQNDCMFHHIDQPFRSLHLMRPGSQELRCVHDFVTTKEQDRKSRKRKIEPKKLEYKHLEGLPCILILVEKGRMGDTFPHSFNCLDLRIRTSENTSTFVQEIGRLCRYPGTLNERTFTSWEAVEEQMFDGGDPFHGGRKVLAVSYLSECKKFLGYATHKGPWDDSERASGEVLFAGGEFIVATCKHNAESDSTEIELQRSPDASWGSLVHSRMAVKLGSTLTKAMLDAGVQEREFHDIIEHHAGSPQFKLKGDCSIHFTAGKSSVTVIRDENNLQWLCEEALRRCRSDRSICFVEEVAYSFPYTLVTKGIMTKLQSAVQTADRNYPRQIWECIKLQSLDNYVVPGTKNQKAAELIDSKMSRIHEYRQTYLGAKGRCNAGKMSSANADAFDTDRNYIRSRSMDDPRRSLHLRRFVLSAETQIGKTGAYCWFLKLLNDEIHGELLPRIPSKSVPLPHLGMTDKVKWLLPCWLDISRQRNPWELKILPAKYHCKVKLQRLHLLLAVLKDDEHNWKASLIARLRGLTDGGECVQTKYHGDKLDELEDYLKSVKGKPLNLRNDLPSFAEPDAAGKAFLKKVIDWDVEDSSCSVYSAGSTRGDKTDLLDTPGLSKQGDVYVIDENASVQMLAFENGCKMQPKGAAASGHCKHDFLAKVHEYASSRDAEKKDLASGRTRINGTEVAWEALFGAKSNSDNWPQLSIPSTSKDAFKYEGGSITSISKAGHECYWIFTPSYRRHLQGVTSALLDRRDAFKDEKDFDKHFVQVLIVRRGEEFDRYREDFGQDYVVIGMPDYMTLHAILKATKAEQFRPQFDSDDSAKVHAHAGGIGYSRLFIQIFSRLMELPSVWVLDDNVQACYDIQVDDIFTHVHGASPSMPPPRPCTFSKIIRTISGHFAIGREAERQRLGEEQRQNLEALLTREPTLQPCPFTDDRQTPRCHPTPGASSTSKPKNVDDFCGQSKEFAVVGMSRDPGAFSRFAGMKHPFKVTHSVYSFYLLNVKHTVDRGVFYPPKQFWEDIHFNQLCDEKDMVVLKHRHLFHHKKNLQPRNPTVLPDDSKSTVVDILIEGEKLEIKCRVLECREVWPQVLDEIRAKPKYQGCIVARARGTTQDEHTEQLSLENEALSAVVDVATDAVFVSYEVDLLYPMVDRADDEESQDRALGGTQHKDILHAWMTSNKICSVFTFPDPDDVTFKENWQLLERQGDGGQDALMKDVSILVFKPRDCAEKLKKIIEENQAEGRWLCLTVICDAVSKRGAENVLQDLRERVEKLLEFLGEEQSKLKQVYFIFPEQLVASYVFRLNEIGDLFKDTHSGKIYCSRRTQASVPQEHEPAKDSTFTILILRLGEENVVDSHGSTDMGAHHGGGDASGGIGVDGDGDCESSRLEKSAKETAKRKRDGQGGASGLSDQGSAKRQTGKVGGASSRGSATRLDATEKINDKSPLHSNKPLSEGAGRKGAVKERSWEDKWARLCDSGKIAEGGCFEFKTRTGALKRCTGNKGKFVIVRNGKEYEDPIAFAIDGQDLSNKSFEDKRKEEEFAITKLGDLVDKQARGLAIWKTRSILYRAPDFVGERNTLPSLSSLFDDGGGRISTRSEDSSAHSEHEVGSSCVRRSFDNIHVYVNFHSTATKLRLDEKLTIEKLDPRHASYKSAQAFADIHGPVFHFSVKDGRLEDEVDVCFEIPITDGMCAQSLVLLRLPSDGGSWEVAGRGSFRRFFADGKVFLRIRTRSFSCFTWGCCTIRAAFHCFRTTSGPTVKVIIYPDQVKFPFPREAFRADGGEMKLEGFGVVQPANGSNPDVLLQVDEEFKIGFSFQQDESQIRFDRDKDMNVGATPEGYGLSKFQHGGHFIYTPTICEHEYEQHKTMHVWIACRRQGVVAGSSWKNTHLGELPLSKANAGSVLKDDFKFQYFPGDAGRQRHCCYLPNNACGNNVRKVDPREEDPDRPPLQTRRFEATAYCRFCGNSLCPSHMFSQKFQTYDIGELCQEHTDVLKHYQQSIRLERAGPRSEHDALGKGKAPGYEPAHAQPQGDVTGLRFALTLGNGHYKHYGQMAMCRKDASEMKKALEGFCFTVKMVEDAKKSQLEQAFDKWLDEISSATQQSPCTALFHASCHGLEVDDENFLVPVDAETIDMSNCAHSEEKKCKNCAKSEVRTQCTSLQALFDKMTSRLPGGSLIILFLDCCREDLTKSVMLNAHLNSKFAKLKLAEGLATTAFIGYATEPGKTASTRAPGTGHHSPFTYAILDCLKQRAIASADIESFYRSVKALVLDVTAGDMNPERDSQLTRGFRFLQASPQPHGGAAAQGGSA